MKKVIVIGGGHAGIEASLACARLGVKTLLVTGLIDRIGAMSCNPAVGGIGKGHLVREIDALGGEMAKAADVSSIHSRVLNSSRGPAVQAVRCQSDMEKYRQYMHSVVMNEDHLSVRQDDVIGLIIKNNRVIGIQTRNSGDIFADAVIITTGTFLGGKLHLGKNITDGGRAGEAPMHGLSLSLHEHGLRIGRLKTGTCPRLDGRTINMDVLEEQKPQLPAPRFAMFDDMPLLPQISCRITHTNKNTHEVILEGINQGLSPVYNGQISSVGPRYCPSIDDKISRFKEKESHLIFLEPHGLDTTEYYPNGLSTSLPADIQLKFLRTMKGLEKVEVTRWGYSVEYDYVDPTELTACLQTKKIQGLFLAGQINGTTGYEEAAAQGLMAGINAALYVEEKEEFILGRDEAYIGVLIDDLITKGTNEPYRMFTSRAEHRLTLRDDNTYYRLMNKTKNLGLIAESKLEKIQNFEKNVQQCMDFIEKTFVEPNEKNNNLLASYASSTIDKRQSLAKLLKRPQIDEKNILDFIEHNPFSEKELFRASVELKYEGYIERAIASQEKQRALEQAVIPEVVFNERISGLSNEIFEKLKRFRPKTLGQASRIAGITPASLSLIAVEISKHESLGLEK